MKNKLNILFGSVYWFEVNTFSEEQVVLYVRHSRSDSCKLKKVQNNENNVML